MDYNFFEQLVSTKSYGKNVPQREGMAIDLLKRYISEKLSDMTFYQDNKAKIPHLFTSATLFPKIIFACHVDTVLPSRDNHTQPKKEDDRCFVLGGKDMKGGVIAALEGIKNSRLWREKAALLLYGDEEYEQNGIREMADYIPTIIQSSPKVIISPESRFNLVHSARGLCVLDVLVKGKKAHSARPQQGIDAVQVFVEAFKELCKGHGFATEIGKTTFTIVSMEGGTYDIDSSKIISQENVTPDTVHAVISVRNSHHNLSGAEYGAYLKKEIEKNRATAIVTIVKDYPPRFTPKKIVGKMIKIIKKVLHRDILIGSPEYAGYNDTAILGRALNSPVINFGPYGEENHTADEWVSLKSIDETAAYYSAWIDNL
jgi:succinyl-diaminopimelate desuccinylase